jgi:hypothetical protein
LGFRWSAVNNLFLTPGDLAADEWRDAHAADEETAERAQRQFVWCLPVVPSSLKQTSLEAHELAGRMTELAGRMTERAGRMTERAGRMTELPRGIVPPGTLYLAMGIDLGKYLCHWIAGAWTETGASGHIVDYGRAEVASDDLGVEQALMVTLRELRGRAVHRRRGW